ncbi:MAG: low temperature requirement protein A [Candidatus Methylomirabilales bacterium]
MTSDRMRLKPQTIVSPDDQKVTFVEKFFDIVFVFSVTQVVSLLHDDLSWITVGQAILVFYLVWWGWSQFTWALNAADTTHNLVQLGVLIATAVAFFLAVALPGAFQDRSLWFAVTYALVRVIGLTLFSVVALEDPTLRAALRTWTILSMGGLIAVLTGGYLGGTAQYWFWGLAIVLDFLAAAVSGQAEEWNIHPEHFGERHGLFVIIALGETLIVAASGVTDALWTIDLLALGVLAVAITCGLWWSYFTRAKTILDHALASAHGSERSKMARSVFSLLHFPMMFGVIAFAASVEAAVANPVEPFLMGERVSLAVGLFLFVGGMAVAIWWATRILFRTRVILILVAATAIVSVAGVSSLITLAIALSGVIAVAATEQRLSNRAVAQLP